MKQPSSRTTKLRSKLAHLTASPYVRGVAALASGTAAAQAVGMIASPFITRLYGPDAFGQLGVFNSTVGLLAPVAAFTYPIAIVMPKRDGDAFQLVKLSLTIAAVLSLVVGAALFFFAGPIVRAMQIEVLRPFLFLIPLTVLFSAGQQVAQQWLIRKRRFGATGKVSVFQAVAVNGAHVLVGVFRPLGTALIWVSSLGKLLHASMLALAARPRGRASLSEEGAPRVSLGEIAHRYRDFPLFRAPQEFVTAASQNLPVVLLAAFFSPVTAGLYTLCRMVLGLPSQLIGTSVGNVFYPRITEGAKRGEDLGALIGRATLALFAVGVLPYLAVVLFGPGLFALVFGNEWREAGAFARWVAVASFSTLLNRPAAQALPVISAQRFNLVLSVITIALRIAGLLVGILVFDSPIVAIAIFSVVGMLANVALHMAIVRFSKRFDGRADQERFG